MRDRRPLYLVGIFFGILVVVGGAVKLMNSSAAEPDSTHDTTTTTSTTVKAAAVDWQPLLDRVIAGENDLFMNPDPANVGKYMSLTCDCYADTQRRITNLKDKGWHVAGDVIKVKKATYVSGTDSKIILYVQPLSGGNPTVDSQGKVIEAAPTGNPQLQVYELSKGADGVWRISDRHLPEEVNP